MFLKLHPKAKIGYKQLTLADLGVGGGNQTHIGLFGETIDFISDFHQQSFAQFIYEDKSKELLSFLDPIQNPDGTFRSPKIRSGNEAELNMLGTRINSVVKEIREIVQKEPDKKWYLLWFGLESEDLVFFLLKEGSVNFSEITQILGELQSRGVIENNNKNFIYGKKILFLEHNTKI